MGSGPPAVIDEMFHHDDKEPPTPTSEASAFSENNLGLDPSAAVGVWVRLVTLNEEVYEGLVYAYDNLFGALVLQSISGGGAGNGGPAGPSDAGGEPVSGTTPSESQSSASTPSLVESPLVAPKPNGRPMSFAAAAAAAASRSSPSTPPLSKKSSAPTSPLPSPSNGTSSPTPTGPVKFDFHIIKLNFIKDIDPLARIGEENADIEARRKGKHHKAPNPLPALVPMGPVSIEKAAAREAAAVARVGLGVTAEAQVR